MTPKQIKALRDQLQMTQTEFATFLGTKLRTVQHWEAGDRRPSPSTLQLLRLIKEGKVKP